MKSQLTFAWEGERYEACPRFISRGQTVVSKIPRIVRSLCGSTNFQTISEVSAHLAVHLPNALPNAQLILLSNVKIFSRAEKKSGKNGNIVEIFTLVRFSTIEYAVQVSRWRGLKLD